MMRAASHPRAATRGQWSEVWDAFDRRKAAKAANKDVAEVDMFGVAAK